MRTLAVKTLATTIVTTLACRASADPVQWSGNGHFYEVVSVAGTISWEDASAAAMAARGYLATITSQAENDFVFSLANKVAFWHGYSGPWLGGYRYPATQLPNANWRWVTGEAWTYTHWQSGQPNDSGGTAENKLQFGFAPLTSVWNDIMSIDPTPAYRPIAYVLEWDHDPLSPTLEIRYSDVPSEIQLCWQTATNRFYQLLYSSTLIPNQWVPIQANWISGDGTMRCVADAIVTGSSMNFYRLLCTNVPSP